MAQMRELLTEELQSLLYVENQLTKALPEMASAAHNPKLKEIVQKHFQQTEGQVERLKNAFNLLGETAEPKACKGIDGLIAEGQQIISEGKKKDELAADLALISTAQKVEHHEISGYGTAKSLARLLGEIDVAMLLSRTLGEEESADYLLTEVAKPLAQEAMQAENVVTHKTEHRSKKVRSTSAVS